MPTAMPVPTTVPVVSPVVPAVVSALVPPVVAPVVSAILAPIVATLVAAVLASIVVPIVVPVIAMVVVAPVVLVVVVGIAVNCRMALVGTRPVLRRRWHQLMAIHRIHGHVAIRGEAGLRRDRSDLAVGGLILIVPGIRASIMMIAASTMESARSLLPATLSAALPAALIAPVPRPQRAAVLEDLGQPGTESAADPLLLRDADRFREGLESLHLQFVEERKTMIVFATKKYRQGQAFRALEHSTNVCLTHVRMRC